MRGGSGFGGEDEHLQAAVGGEIHGLVGEVEVADDGVVDALEAGAVFADVVGSPEFAEQVAAGGEFADEVAELPVVG